MAPRSRDAAIPDYYAVLQVDPSASSRQIRSAFKKLVIAYHPDKNPGRRAWSESRVRELIEAYEVLGNPRSREEFDRRRKMARVSAQAAADSARSAEPYFLHRTDPGSRALLVLHWLLEGNAQGAIRLLQDLEARWGRDFLARNLARGDYLDCLFLLAEFHLARKEYVAALERLRAFYVHEAGARFPRHTTGQVVEMLKDLYLRKLPRRVDPETALAGLEEAARLGLTRAEEAVRVARTVEILAALGRTIEARELLAASGGAVGSGKDLERLRKLVETAERRRPRAAKGA